MPTVTEWGIIALIVSLLMVAPHLPAAGDRLGRLLDRGDGS